MMKVKGLNGVEFEIGMEEMKKVHAEVERRMGIHHGTAYSGTTSVQDGHHHFMIGGKETAITEHEMKIIADAWWEEIGKHSMKHYFEHVLNTAAENIRAALGHCRMPESEKEIKGAIAQAVSNGNPDLIAEVIHEAAEWECGYFGLHSIDTDKKEY
jgi:hypothetical protein